jgi:hypothetical protein
LWIAAARAREPFADDQKVDKKHADLGPDAGRAARYQTSVRESGKGAFARLKIEVKPAPPSDPSAELVTVLMNPHAVKDNEFDHSEIRDQVADMRWVLSIWPAQRECWFARAARPFANNLDWWEAEWSNRTFLEPLLDPDVPLQPMALLMLALGLAAKDATESGMATDALIAAIDDGRLDGDNLGKTLGLLAPTGLVKLTRWARPLSQAARISPLHARVIVHAIQVILGCTATKAPKDLHALLEILKENLLDQGNVITLADARAVLENSKATGKTARLVKDLVNLKVQSDAESRRAAFLRALEQRIRRAESWVRRLTTQ